MSINASNPQSSENPSHNARPLTATTIHGHFGEFLQGRTHAGDIALISVPCEVAQLTLKTTAQASNRLNGQASADLDRQLDAFYQALQINSPKAIAIETNMPFGGGCGYSTALRLGVIAHYFPQITPDQTLSKLKRIENAIDPLMFENFSTLLWGSRKAQIFKTFRPLPNWKICGGFWQEGVQTEAEDEDFPDIEDLITKWETARNLEDFAKISSESAQRVVAHRHMGFDPIWDLAQELDALGVVLAHTGSARGLIFHPHHNPPNWRERFLSLGFHNLMEFTSKGRQK